MKKWSLFFAIAAFSGSCSSGGEGAAGRSASEAAAVYAKAPGLEEVRQTAKFGYRELFQRRIADGALEGRYQKFNQEGKRVEEAYYMRDTLNGPRVLYYPQGDTLSVEMYRMGRFEGAYRAYYENGQLQLSGMYVNNEMSGAWRKYYDTGELMEVVTMKANLENGPFVEYFRNGKLKAEGSYLDGPYEHELLKLYNEEGELVRKMNCDKGVCHTIWKREE